jgi:hypothetical protein
MGIWVTRVGLWWIFSPFCGARGADAPLNRVAAFRPSVLALRGVLRAASPSTARLQRDGSRKRKRQKIATSEELLPRVTRVQRSRIAANISSMAALIFENTCRPCRTILQAV